eukprot:7008185-Pyramimonas_sp.AAC.1
MRPCRASPGEGQLAPPYRPSSVWWSFAYERLAGGNRQKRFRRLLPDSFHMQTLTKRKKGDEEGGTDLLLRRLDKVLTVDSTVLIC